jgi:hypothetical protein
VRGGPGSGRFAPVRGAFRAVAVAVVALAAAAAPAQAAPEWIQGVPETSTVVNCPSQIFGSPYTEIGLGARADVLLDAADLPTVGEVFYARVGLAAVGNPLCGDPQGVYVEVYPPVGVSLAIGPGTPVRCIRYTGPTPSPEPECPQATEPGLLGGPGLFRRPGTVPWLLTQGQGLEIEVPLRSARALRGLPDRPSCPRPARGGPCPPEQSGDYLQLVVGVADGNQSPFLSPAIGLTVAPAPPGAAPPTGGGSGPGTPARLLRAPARATLARALRGIPVTVQVPVAGSTVRAVMTAGGRTIAKVTRRRLAAGAATLRLRPSRAGARVLRRSRPTRARVTIQLSAPGRAVQRAASTIALRRR